MRLRPRPPALRHPRGKLQFCRIRTIHGHPRSKESRAGGYRAPPPPSTPLATHRSRAYRLPMSALTIFGLFAFTTMLVTYACEHHSHWFILAFAAACALGSIYGFLQGAWPFGLVEAVWAVVALRRWSVRQQPLA